MSFASASDLSFPKISREALVPKGNGVLAKMLTMLGAGPSGTPTRVTPETFGSDATRFEVRRDPRGYIVPITVMTLLYLVLELGFNARLLDVTGSLATKTEVTSIERWGRVISGLAVTLFVWGTVLMPRAWASQWTPSRTAKVLGAWALVLMTVTYVGEKQLVEGIVGRSAAETRHSAVELRLVVNAILDGKAQVSGINLSPTLLASPEGKAFLAVLPLQALSASDLQTKLKGPLRGIVDAEIRERVGPPAAMFDGPFQNSVVEIDRKFHDYQANQGQLAQAAIGADPEASWRQYVNNLENRLHTTPDNVANGYRRGVIHEVQQSGVPVPNDWNPADHRAFIAAARSAIANRRGDSAAASLPLGLDKEAFMALPQVQDPWRERFLGHPGDPTGILLSPTMGQKRFEAAIYQPIVTDQVQSQMELLARPDGDFGPAGPQAERGFQAMQALVAPPIALLFSLTGGLVHLFKSLRYGMTLRVASRRRTTAAAVVVASLALLAFAAPNAVSRSQAFADLDGDGGPTAIAVRWIVQAQPYAYPVNEWVRTHLLGGISFGYQERRGTR